MIFRAIHGVVDEILHWLSTERAHFGGFSQISGSRLFGISSFWVVSSYGALALGSQAQTLVEWNLKRRVSQVSPHWLQRVTSPGICGCGEALKRPNFTHVWGSISTLRRSGAMKLSG